MNKQKGFSTILGIIIGLLVIGGGVYFYTQRDVDIIESTNPAESFRYFTQTENGIVSVTNQPVDTSGEEKWNQFSQYWDYYYVTLENNISEEIALTYYGYADGAISIYHIWKIPEDGDTKNFINYTKQSFLEKFDVSEEAEVMGMSDEDWQKALLYRLSFIEKDGYLISRIRGQEPVLSDESILIID